MEHLAAIQTWEDYFTMFETSLSSSFAYEDCPEFFAMMDALNSDTDTSIVEALLNKGLNPQNGLDDYIDVLIGKKFSMDYIGNGRQSLPVVELFVRYGAKMDFSRLFEHRAEDVDYSHPNRTFDVAGRIIDLTRHHGLEASLYGDWKNIPARYFAEMDDLFSAGFTFEEGVRMMLKDSSTYLQSL